jgi:hypothetical protein
MQERQLKAATTSQDWNLSETIRFSHTCLGMMFSFCRVLRTLTVLQMQVRVQFSEENFCSFEVDQKLNKSENVQTSQYS